MNRIQSFSTRVAGRAAMLAGSAFAAEGVVQIVHSQRHSGARVIGLAGHLNLAFFIAGLVLIAPVLVELGRGARSRAADVAGIVAAGGTLLLGVTCVVSMIKGRDPGFFNVLAPLTNLAWLGGSIVISVALWRARRFPGWVALGLPLAWGTTLLLSGFGGGVLGGAYLVAVGCVLSSAALSARPEPVRSDQRDGLTAVR